MTTPIAEDFAAIAARLAEIKRRALAPVVTVADVDEIWAAYLGVPAVTAAAP